MKFEENVASESVNVIIKFFKLVVLLLFLAHWMACFFFLVGSSQLTEYEHSWIKIMDIEDSSHTRQYVTSLYWAFTTMTTVGYGDVSPISPAERIYTMGSMLVGCIIFAYTIGSISTLVASYNIQAS